MAGTLEFAKGHGTGNDFVLIPDPEGARPLSPGLVAALCDRRCGIGGDGVLRVVRTAAVTPPLPDAGGAEWFPGGAEWFMDYRNADGSVAEMCGNGVRVFARYLVDTGLVATGELTLATRTGLVIARVTDEAVSVTMRLPVVYGESAATVAGRTLPGVAVDCGNPHLVCPLPAELPLAELDLTAAPGVDPELFPDGVNVELTAPPPGTPGSGEPGSGAPGGGHVRMRVHERGVGETRSCGSGACAVAAATLRAAGRTAGVVTVDTPGGRLTVSLTADGCALTGPAVLVARGTVDTAALPARAPG